MKISKLAAMAISAALLLAGCGNTTTGNTSSAGQTEPAAQDTEIQTEAPAANETAEAPVYNFDPPKEGEKIAVITVKNFGKIKIKLFPEQAQKAVENFVGLAENNYYDELIFHRIIADFMNQGGDPKGNGTGGSSIWGDRFDGGIPEGLYHFSGAIAYANSGSTATNGSQFYIVNTPEDFVYYGGLSSFKELEQYKGTDIPDNVEQLYLQHGGVPFLDGGYTVFGQVFEGMDVVRAMAQVETDENDKPLTKVEMESVRIVTYPDE